MSLLNSAVVVAALIAVTSPALDDSPKGSGKGVVTPPPSSPAQPAEQPDWKTKSLFTIETKTLEGQPAKLADHSGKVLLIVNVASKCGYTDQYTELEKLAKEFKDKGLVIIGFPCNDFGGQESGTAKEIREFCTKDYTVTFPLMEKISVKPGDTQSIVYRALEAKAGKLPKWNFGKYVVSRDGTKATFFDSKVTPESKELREAIEKALAEPVPAAK